MTPGSAKSRKVLFYLPYPEPDRVIINAHNFTPATWTPSVNGKLPVYAWVPSRDTAGNGTTSLSDLADSRPGTLTNFAMTGSTSNWVADTEAGGVRALDADASNDFVTLGSGAVLPGSGGLSLSWWEKVSASGVSGNRSRFRFNTGTRGWLLFRSTQAGYTTITWGRDQVGANVRASAISLSAASGTWVNFVLVGTAGANSVTPSDWALYENGVSVATVAGVGLSAFTADVNRIGWDGILSGSGCRIDDVRIWHESLTSGDATDIYAAMRGGQA